MCSAFVFAQALDRAAPGSCPVAAATAMATRGAVDDLARVGADRHGVLGDRQAAAAAVDDLAAAACSVIVVRCWSSARRRRPGGRRPAAARRAPAPRAGTAPHSRMQHADAPRRRTARRRRGAAARGGGRRGAHGAGVRGHAGPCGRRRSAGGSCPTARRRASIAAVGALALDGGAQVGRLATHRAHVAAHVAGGHVGAQRGHLERTMPHRSSPTRSPRARCGSDGRSGRRRRCAAALRRSRSARRLRPRRAAVRRGGTALTGARPRCARPRAGARTRRAGSPRSRPRPAGRRAA